MFRRSMMAAIVALLGSVPALAIDDQSLLRSYLGTFEGVGFAQYETGGTDEVRCRIAFDSGTVGKIVLRSSSCRVAGTDIRFTGTMAYLSGQYEAAVTSNVGFSAHTVGRREGDAIIFTLEDGQLTDKSLGLAATFVMTNGGIVVDMNLVSNTTGAVTRVQVPMPRR